MVSTAAVDMRFLMVNHEKGVQALLLQAGLVTLLILALIAGMTRYLSLLRRDSQARKAAQALIQDRTEQLNAVFEISPDGFVSFDQNFCVKFVNPAFRQMTGLGHMALDGMDENDFSAWLASLCDPASRFSGLRALRSAVQDKTALAQETIELKDLGHLILQVQLRLSEAGSVSQILYVRDITHETEVESLKSEFLATAAHELRTPMASIYGFAEVLLTQATDAESQKEFLGIIHKQSRLMVDILNELLDLARIEARRGKDFKYTELCLQDLLADLIKAFQCPAGRAIPELEAPAQPITLLADSGKLRQALLNVLSNAYKYSPDGGAVRVFVELQQPSDHAQRVAIHVSDHGMGMTAEQSSKVFTRFYRADTSGRVPGTGLGMSITKEIVEHHKGTISLISAPGEGTQVSIYLPVHLATVKLPA
jgi:signal transduction histidine kinase